MNNDFKILRKAILCLLLLSLFSQCKEAEAKKDYEDLPLQKEQNKLSQEELINRGEYLVNSIGCHDCHSPKRMGAQGPEVIPELNFSGFQAGNDLPEISTDALQKGWMLMNADLTAFAGPWGISYAANLSSDDTGLGTWSYEQFKTALTQGKYKGMENGRMLLPPMPWQNYKDMKEEDLKAMYEYFMSTEPVENIVPAPTSPDKLASVKAK